VLPRLAVTVCLLAASLGVAVVHAAEPAAAASGAQGTFTPLAPTRILDTRDNTGLSGPFGPSQVRDLTVAGAKGVVPASGVDSVAMNVTVTGPTAGGWLTLFPAGNSLPTASNLNFTSGQTVANLVVVKLGTGGAVSIANTRLPSGPVSGAGSVHVIADVVGWYSDGSTSPAGRYNLLPPSRILDTRSGTGLSGAFAPNQIRNLTVTGVGGVPASGVDAVVLNVTVTQPSAAGFLSLYPAGPADPPLASNLNFVAGQTVPNLVIVEVGDGGQVSIANTALPPPNPPPPAGTVQVIADVVGYYATAGSGSSLTAIAPQRILDTRNGPGVPVQPHATILLDPTAGTSLPPVGAYTGVVVNVTVTGASQGGWLTVFPSDSALPLASNLNFSQNQAVPNLVMVKAGADGRFKIANTLLPGASQITAGTVHVIVDIVGYYVDAAPPPPPPSPYTTAPQGNWTLASGSDGYVLAGFNNGTSDVQYAPGATFALDQGSRNCWTCSTSDVRALATPDGTDRHAASVFDPNQVNAHLSFTAPFTGTLHLYAVDWDTNARRETISVSDGRGPQTVDITTAFDQGAWTAFPVYVPAGGTVSISVTRTAGTNAVLSGVFLGEPGVPPVPPPPPLSIGQYCAPSLPTTAGAYQTAIDNLRKASTGWASADGSVPIALPDGRTLFLYGDTFTGPVNGSGSFGSAPLVANSAVLQTGNCFNPLMRGSSGSRQAWITPNSGEAYWPSSAVVGGDGNLDVFMMRVRYSDGALLGMYVLPFSLPGLTQVGNPTQLTFADQNNPYGATAVADGGFVYLYSTHGQTQHVARAPLTSATSSGAYQFWNGSTWVGSSGSAAALSWNNMPLHANDPNGNPINGYSFGGTAGPIAGLFVVRHGNGFLGTAKLINQFSGDVSLFTAAGPEGPWTYVGTAANTPSGVFTYSGQTPNRLQGTSPKTVTIYSTNVSGTATTIQQYGPRFVTPANVPPPL
jgi:hypothetical protein